MALIRYLHNFPFLLFLFPFIAGIIIGDLSFTYIPALSSCFTKTGMFCSFILLICCLGKLSYPNRWLFGGFLFLFFLFLGGEIAYNKLLHISNAWDNKESSYYGVLKETPKEKEKSFACKIWIESKYDKGKQDLIDRNCLLYIVKDSLSEKLKAGDILLFNCQITTPRNNGNPGEFNYARYLLRNGISGTGVIYSNKWHTIGAERNFDIKRFSLQLRKSLLTRYQQAGITGEEFAILSALTLGYKEELSEEIKNSYSVAGTSHVLALSGLHIGLIFSLLVLCSGIFGESLFGRILRAIIFICCLWAFAFISGLSPSVVRSVCMFSCLIFFQLLNKRHLSLHLLSATAFGMLLYHPFYLYDISFQLSFIAVASIIIISPPLKEKFTFKTRPGKYVWELITISLAAQLGTFPLILYYFNSFPTYFLLANLLVVPLTGVILYLTVLFWGMFLFPVIQGYFSLLIISLIKVLNGIIYFIEGLSFSSINKIVLSPLQVFGIYGIILLIVLSPYINKKRFISGMLCIFLFFSFERFYQVFSYKESPSILFYNTSSVAVHLKNNRAHSLVLVDDNEKPALPIHLQSVLLQNCKYERSTFPDIIGLYEAPEASNYIYNFHGNFICFLMNDYWKEKKSDHPLAIDYLYVSRGYSGTPEDIHKLFEIKNVILHSSLRDQQCALWMEKCRSMQIPFHLLSEGAVNVSLKQIK